MFFLAKEKKDREIAEVLRLIEMVGRDPPSHVGDDVHLNISWTMEGGPEKKHGKVVQRRSMVRWCPQAGTDMRGASTHMAGPPTPPGKTY